MLYTEIQGTTVLVQIVQEGFYTMFFSSPSAESYLWNFGDGVTLTNQNPIHIYTQAGRYLISYTSPLETLQGEITVNSFAEFSYKQEGLIISFTTPFITNSDQYTYAWDFGDGGTSALHNPSHIYQNIGEYSVTLAVTPNVLWMPPETFTKIITLASIPVAEFSASPTTTEDIPGQPRGNYPLMVQFTDLSTNTPTLWYWDFGDGGNSTTEQNPIHTYTAGGIFNVYLDATNAGGTNRRTHNGLIYVVVPPLPAPILSMPAEGAVITSPITFIWGVVEGAADYNIQVATNENFTELFLDRYSTEATHFTGFPRGVLAYWRVCARKADGTQGGWSIIRSFTTVVAIPAIPTLMIPLDGATGVAILPTFNWGTVAGAVTYDLQVGAEETFVSPIINQTGLTETSYVATTPLVNGTLYYWRMRSVNTGGTSAWSVERKFTTISCGITSGITRGISTRYFIYGNTFVLDAVQEGYCLLDYYSKPAKLIAETDMLTIPDEEIECAILYLLQRVLGKASDWEGAVAIQKQYQEMISRVSMAKQSQQLETLWETGGGYD